MMRRKIWILLLCAALILAVGAGGNAVFGNPVSKRQSQKAVENYLKATYPGEPFSVHSISYSSKSTTYDAEIRSAASADTYFTICVRTDGEIVYDTYGEAVTSKNNTVERLSSAYSDWAVPVVRGLNLQYTFDYTGAYIQVTPLEESPHEAVPEFAVPREELEIDGQYDIKAMAEKAGVLEIFAIDETVSEENAARMLLSIRKVMDEAGIPFRAVNFTLRQPPDDYDAPNLDGKIYLENFPYDQLAQEDLAQRIADAAR